MMKELHFYIQSVMILVAMALALQWPLGTDYSIFSLYIAFFLGMYQYGMSWFLMIRLRRRSSFLKLYFFIVHFYFILCLSGNQVRQWLDTDIFDRMLFVIPVGLAVFFLVVIEELLWRKPRLS
ncbi:MAG: hypothetical protein RIC35_01535 [Marinoscillum sp.]